MCGIDLDDWQKWLLWESCAVRDREFWNPYTMRTENKWGTFEFGLVVPRQNGKTMLTISRILAGLFLWGERLIIYSAHLFDTSKEAFELLCDIIESTPEFKKELAVGGIKRSHGEEGIELKNGQRVRFRTRTKGGGRGFTGDLLILDEAMYLGIDAVRALMPTLSARPNPQIWYAGSPGDRNSTQFAAIRARGLRGNDERLLYAGWEADLCDEFCPPGCTEHDDPSSPLTWAKTNPGMGIRIEEEYIAAEYRSIGESDPLGFAMERLGVGDWPVFGEGWVVIPKERWERQENPLSEITGKFVLAVDTAPNRAMSCITACGANTDNDIHVEVTGQELFDHRPGVQWVVPRLLEIWKNQKPYAVIIDKASPAGTMIDELEANGVKVISPAVRDYAQGCGDFLSGISPRAGEKANIVHLGQTPLTVAAASADRRLLSDLWAWSKVASSADICPLVSATLAAWGFKKYLYKKKTTPWVVRR